MVNLYAICLSFVYGLLSFVINELISFKKKEENTFFDQKKTKKNTF